jgi:hypothetical protein
LSEKLLPLQARRIFTILGVHAVVAVLLVPLHYPIVALLGTSSLPQLIEIVIFLLVSGATHGIALGQLSLIAAWTALGSMHWAIRLAVGVALLALVVGCWSLVHVVREWFGAIWFDRGHFEFWFRGEFSEFVRFGLDRTILLSLGYAAIVALAASIAGSIWRVRFTLGANDQSNALGVGQIGIRDVLLATLFVGLLLALFQWQRSFWLNEVSDLVRSEERVLVCLGVHWLVTTPLVGYLAYCTLTRASKMSRSRLGLFLLVCAVETALVVIALFVMRLVPPPDIPDFLELIGMPAIFLLAGTGAQLLVVNATLRALPAIVGTRGCTH